MVLVMMIRDGDGDGDGDDGNNEDVSGYVVAMVIYLCLRLWMVLSTRR